MHSRTNITLFAIVTRLAQWSWRVNKYEWLRVSDSTPAVKLKRVTIIESEKRIQTLFDAGSGILRLGAGNK